ncbi:hypothetical protein JCGZ_22235 [Jatropha curcas]|uniref:F-box domain-containing protein n=1 Tax=Jatropha curcas TaxID=180498 RepID=A0A067K2W9_JATCU|nr:F-box/kelch-repeat protein At3g23880 [Jatropha curcas]KDP26134.1 hypothetical protein JCGZ_22235 [Jatropha curcas]
MATKQASPTTNKSKEETILPNYVQKKQKLLSLKNQECIPDDLIESILLRLPIKSLIRFKCVSKQWQSLLTSHRFVRAFNKDQNQTCLLVPMNLLTDPDSTSIINLIDLKTIADEPERENNNWAEVIRFPYQCQSKFTSCCDGILCFYNYKVGILGLWNPYINDYQEIVLPENLHSANSSYASFYLVYDSSINNYKIVGKVALDFYVLTLKSNRWRKVSITIPITSLVGTECISDNNGSLYLFGSKAQIALRFDIVEEKFTEVPMPPEVIRDGDGISHIFVKREGRFGILGNCLCLTCVNVAENCSDTWMWKGKTWSKYLSIPCSDYMEFIGLEPLCLTEDGAVVMHRMELLRHFFIVVQSVGKSQGECVGLIKDRRGATCKKFYVPGNCLPTDYSFTYTKTLVSPSSLM